MEQHLSGSYPWGHETPSNSDPIGTASPPSHPLVAARQSSSQDCLDGRRRTGVRLALGANLPGVWDAGLTRPAHSGASVLSLRRAENPLGPGVTARGTRCRVPDRIVDVGAQRHSNLERISCSLPPQCAVASLTRHGLELSEARAALVSARRGSDCTLEALPLAAYKKRQHAWGRTWFSWTKVAFCSSPTLNVLGLHRDKPLTAPCGTNKGESTPSTPWPCRPSASAWRSTSSPTGAPFGEKKW